MKQSVRAKRMARNHKRNARQAKLSLVSLMDIFTILVFFLMLNASDVQVLDNHKSITLPESPSEVAAKETLLIMVNNSSLVLQGEKLADIEEILSSSDETIDVLADELAFRFQQASTPANVDASDESAVQGKAITIMGDRSVPYALLKKIMYTCAQAGYTDVSLAVEQKASSTNKEGGA
ncbi:ExbD/TolR family protein [Alteromonas sp. A079]|uniref:ExbD/TolR family protein n=1 Tax=Alteromonas sp. A079 TaxID=3410268 RepID=UPI003B9DF574